MDKKKESKEESEEYEDEEEEEEEDDDDDKEDEKKEEKNKKDAKKEKTKNSNKESKKEEEEEEEDDEEEESKEEEKKKKENKNEKTNNSKEESKKENNKSKKIIKKEEDEKESENNESEEDKTEKEQKNENNKKKKENGEEVEEKSDSEKEKLKDDIKKEENKNEINQQKEETKEEKEIKNDKEKEKRLTSEDIENNNNLNSNKATRPPTIKKFRITNSSSNSNIFRPSSNSNFSEYFALEDLNKLNAKEIRFKDIYEHSKKYFKKLFNLQNQKGCFKCKAKNLNDDNYIIFSCGHKICQECLIKDLLLFQFKNLENKNIIQFNCICLMGKSPKYQFTEFIEIIKQINELKQLKHVCKNHQNEALKYCKDCELWLCDECINIHEVFNKSHILSVKGVPPKLKCKIHTNEFTQFYCLQCHEEVCPFCLTKIGKHLEHRAIKFEKLEQLSREINNKLKYKNYEECEKNLDYIKEKNENEKNKKIEEFKEKIENLIDKIKVVEDNYIHEINEKFEYLNYVIDVMKESYKYFYLMLSKEKKEYDDLTFLKQIEEIYNIKSFYSNYDDIINAYKFIDKFGSNENYYLYEIKIDISPFKYSDKFERILFKKFRVDNSIEEQKKETRIRTKYILKPIKYPGIKFEKNINTKKGNIYSICKTNKDEIAVACGNEIYIISNLSSDLDKSLEKYTSLISHTKNIVCMAALPNNQLSSAGEDKCIKIWDIENKKLISTISKNYIRIDSLLPYKNNSLIVGAYHTIKIIDIKTKEELISLPGHEKSICSIIEIYPDLLATGSYDNTIKVWDLKNKICEYTLYGHDSPVFCILMLKDGRLISGSGSKNKSLKIWNLDKKTCEFSLIGHKREVRDIKQLRNGLVVTASMDKTIKIWNIHKRVCIQTLISHNDVIFSLCVIDKNRFVSGGRDQDIIIWKY